MIEPPPNSGANNNWHTVMSVLFGILLAHTEYILAYSMNGKNPCRLVWGLLVAYE
jgi:hypothetical protein